jgi:two-component system sensor histidine kinase RegB
MSLRKMVKGCPRSSWFFPNEIAMLARCTSSVIRFTNNGSVSPAKAGAAGISCIFPFRLIKFHYGHCRDGNSRWECDKLSHLLSASTDYNCSMSSMIFSSLPGHGQLRRLVALRSIAVAVQLATLAVVWKILEMQLDWQPMLLAIASLGAINIFTLLRLRNDSPVSNPELFVQLSIDVIVLTILLYFSGGSTNPFVSLYLLPLVIAAATLPPRYTWGMAVLTTLCYSILMKFYVPLPMLRVPSAAANSMHDMADMNHNMGGMTQENIFNLHVLGMWLGFVLSAAIIAWFVVQMAQAVRQRDETLARTREEILRNERIVALGTQAAGAAHEMGTPLSTMAVVIGELKNDVTDNQSALSDSLAILDEQIRGCKRILDKILANAQENGAPSLRAADELMTEVLGEWQLLRPAAQYHYHCRGVHPAPFLNADVTLRAALMNLLNNAADTCPKAIEICAHWDSSSFKLEIRDRGEGLNDEALLKAGSAFFTTKKDGRGLGLFLANATIERMGGAVRLFNHEQGGATTELTLPIAEPGS